MLLEELIKFSMVHGGPVHMAVIDSVIAGAISPRPDGSQGLSAEDAKAISNLFLEFVDYCGTIHDVRKAWNRHMKLFPGSARTDLHQQSAKCRRSLNLIKDKREEASVAMPNQPSRDSSSDLQVHLHSQDKKVSLRKFCDSQSGDTNGLMLITQSNDTDTYRLQFMESDDKAEDEGRELPLPVSEEPRDYGPENNVSSVDLVEVKEESTEVAMHLKNNCSESDVSSENLLHQTASRNQSLQALQASSKENDAYSRGRFELEPEKLKPLSLRSMSSTPPESSCPDSGPMMPKEEYDTIPECCKSNSRAVAGGQTVNQDNSASTQDSESAQVHVEINSPYPAYRQDHRARSLLPPRLSKNSGGNWHQIRNGGKFRRGPKYGHRGYTHRKQHQRQQLPPQQIHPAEVGSQMPVIPGYPSQSISPVQQCSQGQNQFQATATDFVAAHSWPMQNILIQNSSSHSQPPANTPSHVLQNAVQGNAQYGYMQNGQEYNQMWQYYYYQQQQQLQLQQHYIQLQPQSFQQQSQQFQHQSQLGHLQPQQLQQLQLQQQVFQQQQFQQQQSQLQDHPAHLQQLQPSTQSSSHSVADQGQAIATSQGHGAISLQQSSESGLVSSVPPHQGEKSTQEE